MTRIVTIPGTWESLPSSGWNSGSTSTRPRSTPGVRRVRSVKSSAVTSRSRCRSQLVTAASPSVASSPLPAPQVGDRVGQGEAAGQGDRAVDGADRDQPGQPAAERVRGAQLGAAGDPLAGETVAEGDPAGRAVEGVDLLLRRRREDVVDLGPVGVPGAVDAADLQHEGMLVVGDDRGVGEGEGLERRSGAQAQQLPRDGDGLGDPGGVQPDPGDPARGQRAAGHRGQVVLAAAAAAAAGSGRIRRRVPGRRPARRRRPLPRPPRPSAGSAAAARSPAGWSPRRRRVAAGSRRCLPPPGRRTRAAASRTAAGSHGGRRASPAPAPRTTATAGCSAADRPRSR